MYKSILVPLDGSPLAERALAVAAAIAKQTRCDLHLVHVYHDFVVDELPLYGFSGEAARAGAENFILSNALRLQRVLESSVDGALLDGSTAQAIVDRAAKVGADLIVMGSHGRTGASRFWLGSVADAVMRTTPVPVLMVRNHLGTGATAPAAFERILVPLDGSELAELALPHAMALAQMSGAHLRFLRVEQHAENSRWSVRGLAGSELDDVQLRLERAERYLDSVVADCSLGSVSREARAAHRVGEAIAQAAVDSDSDLVVMATHGRGASRMIIGSVADKVMRGTQCSVLLVRAR